MPTAIIVHAGAGPWQLRPEQLPEAVSACLAAAQAGQAILRQGGSALDAVERAVCLLEDCPVTDAGVGSYLSAAGNIEMDALIMDGRTLGLGAVAAVERVRHPITLARRVMELTPHTLLAGAGASLFADAIGFPRCTLEELITPHAAAYHAAQRRPATSEPTAMGTVGAVALDLAGHVAAATSTGGTREKLPGRVGDSPLVGCGGYADDATGAVSATGQGEALMKLVISKAVCDAMGHGLSPQAAAAVAIQRLTERLQSSGGVIAVNPRGEIGWVFNTDAMPYAYALNGAEVVAGH